MADGTSQGTPGTDVTLDTHLKTTCSHLILDQSAADGQRSLISSGKVLSYITTCLNTLYGEYRAHSLWTDVDAVCTLTEAVTLEVASSNGKTCKNNLCVHKGHVPDHSLKLLMSKCVMEQLNKYTKSE